MTHDSNLLSDNDPCPFQVLRADSTSPIVLCCEHAGRAVPEALGDLGIPADRCDDHIVCDLGAAEVTAALSQELQAPAILQHYSRLVIDGNRPWSSLALIPKISDEAVITGNAAVNDAQRLSRWNEIHQPFHHRLAELMLVRPEPVLVCIHSFTPTLTRCNEERPWKLGLLFGDDERFARRLEQALAPEAKRLHLGINLPYAVGNNADYTLIVHGIDKGVLNIAFEIRNDLTRTQHEQTEWATLLAGAIRSALSTHS